VSLQLRLPDTLLAVTLLCGLAAPVPIAAAGEKAAQSDVASTRAALREMRKQTLAELYRQDPKARVAIRGAAGYAVFESAGAHVLFVGGSGGRGLVRDNLTGKETFMRMGAVRAGLGVGFEDLRTVLVFKKRQTLRDFMDKGWSFGGDAAAVAEIDGKGGGGREVETKEGILIYQLTKAGAMARGSVAGTRYWKDEELN
jgi:lipid-binding SYLF domain-containing protein